MNLRIEQDTDAESPDTWGDDNLFLLATHRSFYVAPYGKRNFDMSEEIQEHKDTHYVFPLEAYIHSGVALALGGEGNFPGRQWDVSLLGAVFVSKSEWADATKAREAALSLVETWNQYLSGDVWGYIVEDDNGNHLDSCWGFYGYECAKQEGQTALEYATKNSFDACI